MSWHVTLSKFPASVNTISHLFDYPLDFKKQTVKFYRFFILDEKSNYKLYVED